MPTKYITGRTSAFARGGLDDFVRTQPASPEDGVRYLGDLAAKNGSGKNDYAVSADLYNAIASAIVAIERKLSGTTSSCSVADATGLALSGAGHLYVADRSHGRVIEFDQLGNPVRAITAPSQPGAVDAAVDTAGGLLYVTNNVKKAIDVFDLTGCYKGTNKLTTGSDPARITYNATAKYFYVLNAGGNVDAYDAAWNLKKAAVVRGGHAICTGADGVTYCLKRDGKIYAINNVTAARVYASLTAAANRYKAFCVDSSGACFLLDAVSKTVLQLDTSGAVTSTLDSKGTSWQLNDAQAMILDPANSDLLIADDGIAKRVDGTGALMNEFSGDDFVHVPGQGSLLVRTVTNALRPDNTGLYPTGADRWKNMIQSVPWDSYTHCPGDVEELEVNVEFIVKPGEIVWPADIRASVNGFQARVYFKGLPASNFATTMPDGRVKLRYLFGICGMSPFIPKLPVADYCVSAIAYVSKL